jgi:Trk K+ transport system NAD-binding subunit
MAEQPFVLCGMGRIGWRVLDYLRTADLPVVVIDNRCTADDPRLRGARLVHGDCRQRVALEEAGIAQARGVVILTNDDLVNISTALTVRHLHPNVRIVMRLFNQTLVPRLGKAVANTFALSTSNLTAPLFALSALTGQALGSVRLEDSKDGWRQVAEITVSGTSPLRGQVLAQVAGNHHLLILAHLPTGGRTRLLLDVDLEAKLIPGDRVVVCGEPETIAPLLAGGDENLPHVLWAGFLRRLWRMIWQTLSEVDLAVKVCTGVLVTVIAISTIVLTLKVPAYERKPGMAFFHAISLMATGADMQGNTLETEPLMIFASVLRIFGATLLAAFTAIVTNYLLRARLGGALEVRRIPDSGHVVVCGLGNIGFRVVEELVRSGERVVVIEQSRDARFVPTTRRLGVPVLSGDATVAAVLRQAHSAQARAVIAATSDDLINLEIALMAREINPGQRVVLHLSDPNLAEMLRETANIRLALSIPTLAAPAFVAALFGDRVQGVFMIDGRLLATLDLIIPAGDPCLTRQTVRALAIDYNFLPVAVMDAQGSLQKQPMHTRLDAGYRLLAICAVRDLERLMRREPVKGNYSVEVSALPLPARPWIVTMLRMHQGLSNEAAEEAVQRLPCCLGKGLSRGQAEDLLVQCQRERVAGKVRQE